MMAGAGGSGLLERGLRAGISRLMFSQLQLSVELCTAYLSAQQRLEFVLDAFPELSDVDAEVIASVQQQAGLLQTRALSAWLDFAEGYSEAHGAVVTRHAAVLLLHLQQRELQELHATGMLEPRERDIVVGLINRKLLRLERLGISIPVSSAAELLLRLPIVSLLTAQRQRRLQALLREANARRWYETHQRVWHQKQRAGGLLLLLRGTMRLRFDHRSEDEREADREREEQQQRQRQQPAASVPAAATPSLRARPRTSLVRSLFFSRAELTTPEPQPSAPRAAASSHLPPAAASAVSTVSLRLQDTKARGSVIGAYEALTRQATLGSCSSVTMAEAVLLDSEAVALLCEEEDAFVLLARAAADELLKARWRDWAVQRESGLHAYQLPHLTQRMAVHRNTQEAEQQLELRLDDVLLLLDGSAKGRGMRRRRVRRLNRGRQQQPPQPAAAPAAAAVVSGRARVLLYRSPRLLRHRCGLLLLSAGCVYLSWQRRDEEIAALFPPPPRDDLREFAASLGLSMSGLSDRQQQQPQQPQQQSTPMHTADAEAAGGSDSAAAAAPASATVTSVSQGGDRGLLSASLPRSELTTNSLVRYLGVAPAARAAGRAGRPAAAAEARKQTAAAVRGGGLGVTVTAADGRLTRWAEEERAEDEDEDELQLEPDDDDDDSKQPGDATPAAAAATALHSQPSALAVRDDASLPDTQHRPAASPAAGHRQPDVRLAVLDEVELQQLNSLTV